MIDLDKRWLWSALLVFLTASSGSFLVSTPSRGLFDD